jgi:hypothetical protein
VKRRRLNEESSECVETSSDNESEGSLAEFIEHDSAEHDAVQDDESYEAECCTETGGGDSAEEEEEQGAEDDVVVPEEDPDAAIRAQYTPDMEQCGSVVNEAGVRRSTRTTKGKAPQRYVDEDYAELMLEDLTADDRAQLAQEFSSGEPWEQEDETESETE